MLSVLLRCPLQQGVRKARVIVRSLSAKYRPDRYKRDKSVKFGTELP